MANVFINGIKSKTGGGKVILNDYLAYLKRSETKNKYYVLTPDKNEYLKFSCNFIEIVEINSFYKNNYAFPILYHIIMPYLLRAYNINVIFNFGDIIIPTSIPQIYLFDWAYAVYPKSIAWKRMGIKDFIARKIKMLLLLKYIKYATVIIAQTKIISEKLKSIYGLNNIVIIPNAISNINISESEYFNFDLPKDKTVLLYLTYYYTHKNIEILIPLASKIKELSLPYCIVITIDKNQHKLANKLIEKISQENLLDIIINVGNVKMEHVLSLYQQCDALLMPTLLESYGLTYIEAMYHGKIILTSNLEFAKDVCGDAAFYFDPMSINSIIESISNAFNNSKLRDDKIMRGKKQLNNYLSMEQVFGNYNKLVENELLK